jgi:hypothetical protein
MHASLRREFHFSNEQNMETFHCSTSRLGKLDKSASRSEPRKIFHSTPEFSKSPIRTAENRLAIGVAQPGQSEDPTDQVAAA